MRRIAYGVATLILLAAAGCGTVAVQASEPAQSAELQELRELRELIQQRLPAYCFIGGGSGAIISADGYVITNAHVAGASKRWKLRTATGEYHSASVVGVAPGTDLCLLRIDNAQNLPFLPLGDSDRMELGDVVLAFGNPFALGNTDGKPTVTLGVVSALHVDRPSAFDAIQTDTPLNPGNSGGPLINLRGELVGINAQIQPRFGLRQNTGVGYAISSNQVKRFLPVLKAAAGRTISPGRIKGITLDGERDRAAVVRDVAENSPMAKAGVRKGDVIVALDKAPILTVGDFVGAVNRYPGGAAVTLRLQRPDPVGGPPHELYCSVTIAKPGRPYLGIQFDLKKPDSLAVGSVDPGSPAAKAGIKAGDIVAGVGPMAFRTRQMYYSFLARITPGANVALIVRRANQNVVVPVVVGEKETEGND